MALLTKGSKEPAIGADPTFFTHWACPFAQRSWIVVNEKKIPAQIVQIDLKEKPEWYPKFNPEQKVPAVTFKDADGRIKSVWESLIVNEFLNDQFPQPPLLPSDALGRAQARLIIDHFGNKTAPALAKLLYGGSADQEVLDPVDSELRWLEAHISKEGPFFLGKQLSLVDAALAPWFLRLEVIGGYKGYHLPSDTPTLSRWAASLWEVPAIKQSFHPPNGTDYKQALLDSYKERIAAAAK